MQNSLMPSPKGDPVIDIPVLPDILKPLFHSVIGQYLLVSDDFTSLIRKFTIMAFLATSLAASPAAAWQFYRFQRLGEVSDFIVGAALIGLILVCTIVYVRLRMLRLTTEGMIFAMSVGASAALSSFHFCSFSYDPRFLDFSFIITVFILQTPKLRWFVIWHSLLIWISNYNDSFQAHQEDVPFLINMPGTRVTSGVELWILRTLCWFPASAIMVAAYFSQEEQKRQSRADKLSTELAQKVVAQLRRYNTDRVLELVEEARVSKETDDELLEAYAALVKNLERYRPFLPNYLFLSTDSDTDKEPVDGEAEERGNDPEGEKKVPITNGEDEEEEEEGSLSRYGDSSVNSGRSHGSYSTLTQHTVDNTVANTVVESYSTHNRNHYRGMVSYARVELQSNEWFSVRLSHKSERSQKHNLFVFTDTLFDIATVSKASIHCLVGDSVQVSWNATHRVAQPESKAATFLLRLKEALRNVLPHLDLVGACASGIAEVHSVSSISTKQHALYIDAPWLPVLNQCYDLACQYKALVIDADTAFGAEYEVVVRGVDVVRYQPRLALLPDGSRHTFTSSPGRQQLATLPTPHHSFTQGPPLKGEAGLMVDLWEWRDSRSGSPLPAAHSADPVQHSPDVVRPRRTSMIAPTTVTVFAFELTQLHHRKDAEWMYQLGENSGAEGVALGSKVVALAVQGRFGEAVVEAEKVTEQQTRSALQQRLVDFCHRSLLGRSAPTSDLVPNSGTR